MNLVWLVLQKNWLRASVHFQRLWFNRDWTGPGTVHCGSPSLIAVDNILILCRVPYILPINKSAGTPPPLSASPERKSHVGTERKPIQIRCWPVKVQWRIYSPFFGLSHVPTTGSKKPPPSTWGSKNSSRHCANISWINLLFWILVIDDRSRGLPFCNR